MTVERRCMGVLVHGTAMLLQIIGSPPLRLHHAVGVGAQVRAHKPIADTYPVCTLFVWAVHVAFLCRRSSSAFVSPSFHWIPMYYIYATKMHGIDGVRGNG